MRLDVSMTQKRAQSTRPRIRGQARRRYASQPISREPHFTDAGCCRFAGTGHQRHGPTIEGGGANGEITNRRQHLRHDDQCRPATSLSWTSRPARMMLSMVARSKPTDGRSASECEGRPGQIKTLGPHLETQMQATVRNRDRPSRALEKSLRSASSLAFIRGIPAKESVCPAPNFRLEHHMNSVRPSWQEFTDFLAEQLTRRKDAGEKLVEASLTAHVVRFFDQRNVALDTEWPHPAFKNCRPFQPPHRLRFLQIREVGPRYRGEVFTGDPIHTCQVWP